MVAIHVCRHGVFDWWVHDRRECVSVRALQAVGKVKINDGYLCHEAEGVAGCYSNRRVGGSPGEQPNEGRAMAYRQQSLWIIRILCIPSTSDFGKGFKDKRAKSQTFLFIINQLTAHARVTACAFFHFYQ